jgi:hypothetical protein
VKGRTLHEYVLAQVGRRLGGRSWAWLAREAEVPRSTLMTQKARPKFTVEVVVRVADALRCEVGDLMPRPTSVERPDAIRLLQELHTLLQDARRDEPKAG